MGEVDCRHCLRIASRTLSVFSRTSLFQNRSTTNPFACRQASRCPSYCSFSPCCPPSSSMTIFLSKVTKSTIYASIGCCLRNLTPSICLLRKKRQRRRSVSVLLLRNSLAKDCRVCRGFGSATHPSIPSRRGRGRKNPKGKASFLKFPDYLPRFPLPLREGVRGWGKSNAGNAFE